MLTSSQASKPGSSELFLFSRDFSSASLESYPNLGASCLKWLSICSRESVLPGMVYIGEGGLYRWEENSILDMWEDILGIMWITLGAHYSHLILSLNYGYPISSPLNLYSTQIVFRHRGISDISRHCLLIMTFQIQRSFTKAYGHRRVQEEFNWIWNVERQMWPPWLNTSHTPSF